MKLLEAVKYLAASAVGVNNCKICVLRTLLNFHYPKTHSKEGVEQEEEGESTRRQEARYEIRTVQCHRQF